jgi:hypothetical protein
METEHGSGSRHFPHARLFGTARGRENDPGQAQRGGCEPKGEATLPRQAFGRDGLEGYLRRVREFRPRECMEASALAPETLRVEVVVA